MKLIYTIITTLCFSTLLLMSCKSDKSAPLETKSPNQSNYCDTANVSFSNDLQPLFLTHCAYSGCHNTGTAASNIILDNQF